MFDIFPCFVIILFVAHDMIIIGALPNILSILLIAKAFECADKLRDYRVPPCSARRGSRPRLPVMTVNGKQQVDMIRHDHIFIYGNMIVKIIHLSNVPVRDFPMLQQLNMRR